MTDEPLLQDYIADPLLRKAVNLLDVGDVAGLGEHFDLHRHLLDYRATPLGFARFFGFAGLADFIVGNFDVDFGDAVDLGLVRRVAELLGQDASLATRFYGEPDCPDHPRLPLVEASHFGNPDIVRLLLRHGADPSSPDREGYVAIDVARRQGHGEIVDILQAWEAES